MPSERMTGGDGDGGDITVTAAATGDTVTAADTDITVTAAAGDTGDATVTAADTGDTVTTAATGDITVTDTTAPPAFTAALAEAGRQVTICNACRYCEGYCAVFPAMFARRAHAAADLVQLANLCHNCRGCYYACQYAPPHEFALNLPAALAEAQAASWREFAWPAAFARLFERAGSAIAVVMVAAFALLLGAASAPGPAAGSGFYATLSHAFMVAVFAPAFIAPLLAIGVTPSTRPRRIAGSTRRSCWACPAASCCASAARAWRISKPAPNRASARPRSGAASSLSSPSSSPSAPPAWRSTRPPPPPRWHGCCRCTWPASSPSSR